MPFCTECGHENPGTARFCSQCGHRLLRTEGGPSETTATIAVVGGHGGLHGEGDGIFQSGHGGNLLARSIPRRGAFHQRSFLPRSAFLAPSRFLTSRRRFCEPLEGLVARRTLGTKVSALSPSRSRSSATPLFCT